MIICMQVNHRKLLDGIFAACGVPPEKFRPVCSAVDKLDKVTSNEVYFFKSPEVQVHLLQLDWPDVKNEMIEVKGLDSVVAGRIGKYVVCKGNLSRCLYIELIN